MPPAPPEDKARPSIVAELRAAVERFAERDTPLQVGELGVDEHGRLCPREAGTPLTFGFLYRGIGFNAEVRGAPDAHLSLNANLGKLPFSAELGVGRAETLRILADTAKLPRGQIVLSQDHDIQLCAESPAPTPLTPAAVMATLTALLLDFKPYIELLRASLTPPRAQNEP